MTLTLALPRLFELHSHVTEFQYYCIAHNRCSLQQTSKNDH